MRTEQLYYFLETVRCGSFSKAADNLFIKQPSLRESINHLENEIGAQLFHTSNKGVTLTNYGKKCVPVFQKMLSLYENIKLDAPIHNDKPLNVGIDFYANEILKNIACSSYTKASMYAQINNATNARYVLIQDAVNCLEYVLDDTLDFACLLLPSEGYTSNKNIDSRIRNDLSVRRIGTISLYMVISKNHPLCRKNDFTLKDLQGFEVLVPEFIQLPLMKYAKRKNLSLDFNIADPHTQTNKLFLSNAIILGDAMIYSLADYTCYSNIIKIDISDMLTFSLYAFYPKNTILLSEIEKFLATLNL